MFVSIEGINGVGKSEVVNRICAKTNFKHYAPPSWLHEMSAKMEDEADLDARYLLFMSAMTYASTRIRKLVASGNKIIVSGFYKRTIAYHRGMGSAVEFAKLPDLIEPTLSILLMCRENERLRRLRERGRPTSEWDYLAQDRLDAILDLYQSYCFPTIDTSDQPVEAVVAQVLMLIEAHDGSRLMEGGAPSQQN